MEVMETSGSESLFCRLPAIILCHLQNGNNVAFFPIEWLCRLNEGMNTGAIKSKVLKSRIKLCIFWWILYNFETVDLDSCLLDCYTRPLTGILDHALPSWHIDEINYLCLWSAILCFMLWQFILVVPLYTIRPLEGHLPFLELSFQTCKI